MGGSVNRIENLGRDESMGYKFLCLGIFWGKKSGKEKFHSENDMTLDLCLSPCTRINLRWIKGFTVKKKRNHKYTGRKI